MRNSRCGIASGGGLPFLHSIQLTRALNDYRVLGARWIRFDVDWSVIQATGPTEYDWTAYDVVVKTALACGFQVLGLITYTPTWAMAQGGGDVYHTPPRSTAEYATFAASAAARYAPLGVHAWEIWNEPNGGQFTTAFYSALLQAAYTAIKAVDPRSFVLTGGMQPAVTSGGDIAPVNFLTGIYQHGGQGYFDAVAHHPYCYVAGFTFPFYAPWSAWSQMQDTHPSLRSVMKANGDSSKKIWVTEFGAPTSGGIDAVSETQQAQLVTNAYRLFQSYSWSGPLFWYSYHDNGVDASTVENFFGLVRNDFSRKPAYAAYRNVAH